MLQFLCLLTYSVYSRTPTLTAYVNLHRTSWTASNYERWNDKSDEYFQKYFNVIIDKESSQAEYKIHKLDKALPSSFSSATNWPGCESIRDIRDQGNCGSCWAVSAVSTMSDRLCIRSSQTDQRRVSAEDLLTCCGYNCGYGCDGGYPEGAWKYLRSDGIVTGSDYANSTFCKPYTFPPCSHGNFISQYSKCDSDIFLSREALTCLKSCHSSSGRVYSSDKIKTSSNHYFIMNSAEQIMNEIYLNGPVQSIFSVYEDFLNYKTGIYQYTSGKYLGNHAVKIVGWGTESGINYWEVVNSWNASWGMSGKFRIVRGTNHLGIEANVIAGLVD